MVQGGGKGEPRREAGTEGRGRRVVLGAEAAVEGKENVNG